MANNETNAPGIPRPRYPSAFNSRLSIGTLMSQGKFEYRQASAIAEMMRQAMEKQAVDEETNYRWIEDRLGGGGVRSATRIVAADNAHEDSIAGADYVCDGFNDEVEIQAAIDEVQSLPEGGQVVLLEGTFNISGEIVVNSGSPLELSGQGPVQTTILGDSGWPDTALLRCSGNRHVFRNFEIHAGGASTPLFYASSAGEIWLDRLRFFGGGGPCVMFEGGNGPGWITQCSLFLGGSSSGRYSIEFINSGSLRSGDFLLSGNYIVSSAARSLKIKGNSASQTANTFRIIGNEMDGDIFLQFVGQSSLVGNALLGPEPIIAEDCVKLLIDSAHSRAFQLTRCSDSKIRGLFHPGGVDFCSLVDCSHLSVDVDIFMTSNLLNHVLTLNGTSDCSLKCHMKINSGGTHNTYDGIFLTTNSDNNNIQGCIIRGQLGSADLRHAIRIDTASCDGNFVTNNDMRGGGATTAGLSDAGTGTITTAGNH